MTIYTLRETPQESVELRLNASELSFEPHRLKHPGVTCVHQRRRKDAGARPRPQAHAEERHRALRRTPQRR